MRKSIQTFSIDTSSRERTVRGHHPTLPWYLSSYSVCRVLFALYFGIDKLLEPFHQHFSLSNYTLQYPYAEHERVSLRQTGYIAFLAPAVIIFVYTIIIDGFLRSRNGGPRHSLFQLNNGRSQRQVRSQLWELNCGWLGLGLAEGLAFFITVLLKRLCGKPRPELIARCLPKPGSIDRQPFGLSDISICTQTDRSKLQDGFMIWHSGHSSSEFQLPTSDPSSIPIDNCGLRSY